MRKQFWILPVAVSLVVAGATAALTQTQTPARTPARPPAKAPARAPAAAAKSAYQSNGFAPGFDDLMTMLVQPRHIRLYYAGQAKNWEMAAAESRDLRQSFDRLSQSIPDYEGNDVAGAVANFVKTGMDALDAAIAAADEQKFAAAYQEVTAGCNNCHTYMEHPYLVIKTPSRNAELSDQDFEPAKIPDGPP
jgi:hypothetical protein